LSFCGRCLLKKEKHSISPKLADLETMGLTECLKNFNIS
jgi:hypothetical protein